jgi:ATP-dependent Clp protease protease subunit
MSPYIYEKTKDGEMMYDVFSRLVKDRIVFLSGEVNTDIATTISATLLWLDNQDHDKEISLYLNSPGGLVHSGLFTIIDTMNYIKAPVKTVCIGEAYSAAALILSNGTKGRRLAFENSNIMIHDIQAGTIGSFTNMEKDIKRFKHTNDRLMNILSKNTGKTISEIKEQSKEDSYFTAKEALKFGLIDKIVKSNSSFNPKEIDDEFNI